MAVNWSLIVPLDRQIFESQRNVNSVLGSRAFLLLSPIFICLSNTKVFGKVQGVFVNYHFSKVETHKA